MTAYSYKLSIIVPVYNVEKYIVKCISSLLNQNHDSYELIIVNDGTKDDSINLIKQNFNDKRISIINQENEGLSSARNTGLHNAKGEYIWFFDSDDWISNNALKDIINQLSSCDILYFKSYYMERENNTTIYSLSNKENIGINFVKKRFHHGAPFYIYKKKMLINDNLYFEKGIYHEDTLFTPQTLFKCQSVKQYDIPVYHRLIRENSITTTINPKRCYDLCFVLQKLHSFSLSNMASDDKYKWTSCMADAINECLYLTQKCDSKVQNDISSFFKKNNYFINYLCNSDKSLTRLLGYITQYTKLPLFTIYRILYKLRYIL